MTDNTQPSAESRLLIEFIAALPKFKSSNYSAGGRIFKLETIVSLTVFLRQLRPTISPEVFNNWQAVIDRLMEEYCSDNPHLPALEETCPMIFSAGPIHPTPKITPNVPIPQSKIPESAQLKPKTPTGVHRVEPRFPTIGAIPTGVHRVEPRFPTAKSITTQIVRPTYSDMQSLGFGESKDCMMWILPNSTDYPRASWDKLRKCWFVYGDKQAPYNFHQHFPKGQVVRCSGKYLLYLE